MRHPWARWVLGVGWVTGTLLLAAPGLAGPWRLVLPWDPDGRLHGCFPELPDGDVAVSADENTLAYVVETSTGGLELRVVAVKGAVLRRFLLLKKGECESGEELAPPARVERALRAGNEFLSEGGFAAVPALRPRLPRRPVGPPTPPVMPSGPQELRDSEVSVQFDVSTQTLTVRAQGRVLLKRRFRPVRLRAGYPGCRTREIISVDAWRSQKAVLVGLGYGAGHTCQGDAPGVFLAPIRLPAAKAAASQPAASREARPVRLDSRLRLEVRASLEGLRLGDLPAAQGLGMEAPPGDAWTVVPHDCRSLDSGRIAALSTEVRRLGAPGLNLVNCTIVEPRGLETLKDSGVKALALRTKPQSASGPIAPWDLHLRGLRGVASLETLELVGDVSGRALGDLVTMPRLKRLIIRGARVQNRFFTAVLNLKLHALEFHESEIEPAEPDFAILANLSSVTTMRELSLVATRITHRDFAHVASVGQLTKLTVRGLRLTGTGVAAIGRLRRLQTLVLVAGLSAADLEPLCRLAVLESLTLGGEALTNTGLKRLQCLTLLRELHLGPLPAAVDGAGIRHLIALPHLRTLDVSGSRLTDAAAASLGGLRRLRELHLDRTPITDASLAHLRLLSHLEVLSLRGTRIASGLDQLRKLKKLRELRLDDTPVDDAALTKLASLPSLRLVSVCGSRVTSEGRARLERLSPTLQVTGCRLPGVAAAPASKWSPPASVR